MNPSDVAQKYSSKYTSTLSNKTISMKKQTPVNVVNELNFANIMN